MDNEKLDFSFGPSFKDCLFLVRKMVKFSSPRLLRCFFWGNSNGLSFSFDSHSERF